MKICPKCSCNHELPGTYCSRKCANSRVFLEESKQKTRESLVGRKTTRPEYDRDSWKEKIKATWLAKYLETSFDNLGVENRRRRVFEEQCYKCNKCGIAEWFGNKISLELEHKDGDNKNNVRENLEGLCPNCHSITDTWRGRNKLVRTDEIDITDESLLQYLKDASNIRQGLLKAGLAAKGSNYARARRLMGVLTQMARVPPFKR